MATARKTALKLVQPNLEELERTVKEFAEQQAPMVSRSSSVRQKFEVEAKAIEADIAALDEREQFVDRLYEAVKRGFAAERGDMQAALGLYTGGLTRDDLAKAG